MASISTALSVRSVWPATSTIVALTAVKEQTTSWWVPTARDVQLSPTANSAARATSMLVRYVMMDTSWTARNVWPVLPLALLAPVARFAQLVSQVTFFPMMWPKVFVRLALLLARPARDQPTTVLRVSTDILKTTGNVRAISTLDFL